LYCDSSICSHAEAWSKEKKWRFKKWLKEDGARTDKNSFEWQPAALFAPNASSFSPL
jgi:hypothetical protein